MSWRRLVTVLAALPLAATLLVVVGTAPASAATRAFTPVYTTNTTGDVMLRGNSLETCPAGSFSAGSTTLSCANVQSGTSNGQNNNFFMSYVDTDSDSATFNSSSSTVTIPTGATVLYAGLSWSGSAGAGSATGYPALTGAAAPTPTAKGTVNFKVPGSSSYSTLNSTQAVDSTGSGYQGFVNVTTAVRAAGSGVYTVANVQAGTGGGDYAGWALAVAYRDPTQPIRNLVIYNGFTNVSNGASTSIPITGFTTPLTGPVVTRLGAVVYEGDRNNVGDTMTLGANAISNATNPVNDVENSSISDLGVPITNRTPAYANTLSIDIDRFDATGFLTNGQTSTTVNLKTVGDSYYPGLISLATNLYSPSLQATKTVKDVTNGITGTVKTGDVLAYSMAISNVGGDGSTSSTLTDVVPAGTTYVPGSLVIGGTPVTDASGDDAGNVTTGTVTARLGTDATATAGGTLATGAATTVAFNVTVNAGTANGVVISNAAALGYSSATTGTAFIGTSNTVSSTVAVINVNPVLAFAAPPSGEVSAAYTTTLTAAGGTGPYTWAVTTGTLPTGLSLSSTTGVVSGTPTASGTYTFTVSATDANAQVATETTSIYIAPQPVLAYPATLQNADTNNAYSYPLGVNPGTGPYVWSVSVGTLPAGLTLDPSTGVIAGTPTVAGTRTFTVKVVDAFGASATEATTLTVLAGPTLNYAAPPAAEINVPYSVTLPVVGGAGPYIWTTTGTLPAGITLDSSSGLLSGTPTATGTSNFTVTVTDVNGATASQATPITVVAAPTLTGALATGEVNATYSNGFTVNDGIGPFVWSVSSGPLPTGLSINSATGLITGTPTAAGSYPVTIQVSDAKGVTATRAATIVVNKATSTVSVSAPASARFGSTVTVTAAVGPSGVGGLVTFTDVPTTGPQAGSTVTLGTGTVSGGAASVTTTLPAFGVNTLKASYGGDATHAAVTSTTTQVEVSAYTGEVIVTEFRTSGPGGAADSYVELLNTGPTVPLAGMKVSADSGAVTTLPANAGLLGTGRSYLLTGDGFTLAAIATSDYAVAALGTGGMKITAPDTAGTRTDAVGPATGFHTGSGLPAITGNPDSQWAWVRTELAGAAVDTGNNAADFQLVSTGFAAVGGVQPTLGSASPTGTADPYQHNAALQSTLLDTSKGAAIAPNRVVVSGTPGRLVIRRTITNTGGQTITAAKVRVSALSEQFGAPQPGVATQPANVALLRAINATAATEQVTLTGGAVVTVNNLSVDAPNAAGIGGGLNSTFTVPLPSGGLAPGASINVAFSFAFDTRGTFWFGYDVDAVG